MVLIWWCIFGPTPIRPTAYPTYYHVVLQLLDAFLAAAPGPLACPSRGARPPSTLAAALGPEIVLT